MLALFIPSTIFLISAFRISRHSNKLDDHLPLTHKNHQAKVQNSQEFSASTVATTISLATVILAYTELAEYFGAWLFWTVITTALGIFTVRLFSPLIWKKLSKSVAWSPTLHEFLGETYNSPTLSKGAALCTSLGFIGALAVELTVGSRFLVGLIPQVPSWLALVIIAGVGVGYTAIGGFRAVIITDRMQMFAIWAAIIGLGLIASRHVFSHPEGLSFLFQNTPKTVYDFSWREGLGAFLIGISIINIPTYLADMSIWQRIAASQNEETIRKGLAGSVFSAACSWGALALIACLLVSLVTPEEGTNPLLTFLLQENATGGWITGVLLIIVVAGLYSASLSTASTQLIAAAHTLHTDLLRRKTDRTTLANSTRELLVSKWILLISSISSIVIVEILRSLGFSIADLVFAVFGAQLGIVPVVIAALMFDKKRLAEVGLFATLGVLSGFAAGWGAAGYGKMIGDGNLVFLSPAISLVTSSTILFVGFGIKGTFWKKSPTAS